MYNVIATTSCDDFIIAIINSIIAINNITYCVFVYNKENIAIIQYLWL